MSEEIAGFDESKSGLSTASLVLGIVGLLFPICSILAIIFGIITLVKKEGIKGCAIAGIVLGCLPILAVIVVLVFLASLIPGLLALIGIVL